MGTIKLESMLIKKKSTTNLHFLESLSNDHHLKACKALS